MVVRAAVTRWRNVRTWNTGSLSYGVEELASGGGDLWCASMEDGGWDITALPE